MKKLVMEGWVLSLVDGCALPFPVLVVLLFLLGEGPGCLVTRVMGLVILIARCSLSCAGAVGALLLFWVPVGWGVGPGLGAGGGIRV